MLRKKVPTLNEKGLLSYGGKLLSVRLTLGNGEEYIGIGHVSLDDGRKLLVQFEWIIRIRNARHTGSNLDSDRSTPIPESLREDYVMQFENPTISPHRDKNWRIISSLDATIKFSDAEEDKHSLDSIKNRY